MRNASGSKGSGTAGLCAIPMTENRSQHARTSRIISGTSRYFYYTDQRNSVLRLQAEPHAVRFARRRAIRLASPLRPPHSTTRSLASTCAHGLLTLTCARLALVRTVVLLSATQRSSFDATTCRRATAPVNRSLLVLADLLQPDATGAAADLVLWRISLPVTPDKDPGPRNAVAVCLRRRPPARATSPDSRQHG